MTAALAGRRIIEIGTMIAAPFASHILWQLGAEVIKVESPSGDTTRSLVRGGPSGTFIAYNYGKKSVCIDLATADGFEVFGRLVATADAVVHNLSPVAARKLRVTKSDLGVFNPNLIVCHISGYAEGPQEDDLASNPVAEAATGVMFDHRIDGRPSRLGPSYHDQFAACYAVIRLLSAWLQPDSVLATEDLRVGLYETGLHVAGRDLAGSQLKTQLLGQPGRQVSGEFAMPGYRAYEASDGRWIYLLVLTDVHWLKLTDALSIPESSEGDLATLRGRKKRRVEVESALSGAIRQLKFEDVASRLSRAGVGFTEVIPLEKVLESPQALVPGKLRDLFWRGMRFAIPEFPGDEGPDREVGPPEFGHHTVSILEELGYGPDECATVLASGAVQSHANERFQYKLITKTN